MTGHKPRCKKDCDLSRERVGRQKETTIKGKNLKEKEVKQRVNNRINVDGTEM